MLGLEFNISVGLLFICWVVTSSLWPHGLQHTRLPCGYLPEFAQSHVHWVSDAVQPSQSLLPPLLLPSIFPASGSFPVIGSSHQVARVLELQLQSFQGIFRVYFFQDWLVWSLCNPRDSQESSPELQFKTINSSVLSFLYGSALISVSDSWKTIALTILTLSAECYLCFLVRCLGLS